VVTLKAQAVPLTRELPGQDGRIPGGRGAPAGRGIVKRRMFTEGALVKAGQPLYNWDDAPYRATYNNAACQSAACARPRRTQHGLTAKP